MKIYKLASLFIASAFVLSSCSNNETLLTDTETSNSLKSYKVKRDASGAYSLDYVLDNNVKSDKVQNLATNSNEFHLYQSDYTTSQRKSEELLVGDNKLSIGFIDTRNNTNASITIIDDNSSSIKTSAKKNEMLSEYSISNNEDGTFNLDFKVKKKVVVDFVYNEELEIYEIHLEKGNAKESEFSRSFTKLDGVVLRIDFVNHLNAKGSKGFLSREMAARTKPRVIVGNGGSTENNNL